MISPKVKPVTSPPKFTTTEKAALVGFEADVVSAGVKYVLGVVVGIGVVVLFFATSKLGASEQPIAKTKLANIPATCLYVLIDLIKSPKRFFDIKYSLHSLIGF